MDNSKEQLKYYISKLLKIGFKKYELGIENAYGDYFITLPNPSYNNHQMKQILDIFSRRTSIGMYPAVSNGSLSIRTDIKYSK